MECDYHEDCITHTTHRSEEDTILTYLVDVFPSFAKGVVASC